MESIMQTWNGTLSATAASRATATISRNGDLISRMYLESLALDTSTDNHGAVLVENVTLEIGGQQIDKHTGSWMEAWAELTEPNPSGNIGISQGVYTETGTVFQRMAAMGGYEGIANATTATKKNFIPLRFWFCENPGLALPLIALQYHEVKVILNTGTCNTGGAADLWVDYIYLDTDERRRFAQVSHEYLITQVQHQEFANGTATMELNFNHPVKELVWTGNWVKTVESGGSFTTLTIGNTYQLKLNGHDRFAARDRDYFTLAQVWQHHSGYGSIDASAANLHDHAIACYSFALKPEEHQPSGTCNFSRIDNAQLVAGGTLTSSPMNVFAVNYNVLRIMSGMGGLAYSN